MQAPQYRACGSAASRAAAIGRPHCSHQPYRPAAIRSSAASISASACRSATACRASCRARPATRHRGRRVRRTSGILSCVVVGERERGHALKPVTPARLELAPAAAPGRQVPAGPPARPPQLPGLPVRSRRAGELPTAGCKIDVVDIWLLLLAAPVPARADRPGRAYLPSAHRRILRAC